MMSGAVIGIDLGTTFSCAAVYRKGKGPVIIPNDLGDRVIPSVVYYDPTNGDVYVGKNAIDEIPECPSNGLYDAKRIIGRKFDDEYISKFTSTNDVPFSIVRAENDQAAFQIEIDGKKVVKTPQEVSAEVLKYIKNMADYFTGCNVTEAVISVPAYFSNAQRKATSEAAELAGLKVLKLITEPTAAAIHYVCDKKRDNSQILVFDFGGGTLDVSIIKVNDIKFEVKAVYGDTFLGCLSIICTGMHFGWPSPSLPTLLHENSHIPISDDEGSWLAAMPCIGGVPGALLAAYIVDKIGRRTCMLLTSPLYFVAWIMIAYSQTNLMLCAARFLAGASDGIAFTAFPMYLGEIAHPIIRGLLGSSIQVAMTGGILLINIIGSYLDMTSTALISSILPVLHFITFYFMPESPYYSIMKGNKEQAKTTLQKLYASDDVSTELNGVAECVKQGTDESGHFWELFTVKSNRKAVVIVFGVRAIQQFSGINAITFYAKTIFNEAEGNISASLAAIIYFTIQLVTATIGSFLVDKLGRKPLLVFSTIASGIALLIEGLYFCLSNFTNINMTYTKFIPLVALLSYIIVFNLGLGTIPVILLGEVFSTSVKAFALCLSDIFVGCIITIISKFFQIMKDDLGMYVPFFAFSFCCALGLIFIVMYVPETKGKNLEQIQQYLKRGIESKEQNIDPS